MSPEGWLRGGRHFIFNSQRIFYRSDGSGEAVLCLHGWPTSSWDWHALWPALRSRFRVIAADLTGSGFSDKPYRYPYSVMDRANLQVSLLRRLGVDRVHILAHDDAISVVQELLARQSERALPFSIRSVCLLSGRPLPGKATPAARWLMSCRLGSWLPSWLGRQLFLWMLRRAFAVPPSKELLEHFWKILTLNDGLAVQHRVCRLILGSRENDGRRRAALRHAPAPVCYIDGAGRYPHLEAPKLVLSAFLEVTRAAS